MEELVLHLLSGYSMAMRELSLPCHVISRHSPWLLLAVPGILKCTIVGNDCFTSLMPTMLESILSRSPNDLRASIITAASQLGSAAHKSPGDIILCCLNMLSALVHGFQSSAGHMTAQHVVAFSRMARVLVSLLPHTARVQLSAVLINVPGRDEGILEVAVANCFGVDGMDEDDDTDSAFTTGARWFLPGDPGNSSNGSDVPPVGSPNTVPFPSPVAATHVIAAQVYACVGDASFSAADSVRELSLWLFTVLSLSRSNPLLYEKVVTAWATAPCQLVRVIWQQGLRMYMREGSLVSSAAVDQKGKAWQLEQPLQPWMVPLMILCVVYSQYVSTAPDDALFGDQVWLYGEMITCFARQRCKVYASACFYSLVEYHVYVVQAPIPQTELVPDRGAQETGEFIPFLREALYWVIFAGQHGGGKIPCSPDISRPFKMLAGQLFGQLHSRAARRPNISDACFQAKDLQHARFLRGTLNFMFMSTL